jgi:tRNA pseudouridine55 synthase
MTDGVLLIDKPTGMTSFGVVARVRRKLSTDEGKKVKVGHTGTLDPFASGLMIIVVGNECKHAGMYTKLDKVYEATCVLGQVSSTGDPEGELTTTSEHVPSIEAIQQVLRRFTGNIRQRPPIFSAIKIKGQRAYRLAREGQVIEMPLRDVSIYDLTLLTYNYPELTIRAHVSSGTYIRSLAVDIGQVLGTGAYCSQLRRLSIDKWTVDEALSLEEFGITS